MRRRERAIPFQSEMIFDGWIPILRTLIAGLSAYIALIVILRISGKRTLSKWNALDYVVTIALDPTLADVHGLPARRST